MNRTYSFMRREVYYDDGKAWTLNREWVHGKVAGEEWVRVRKYDAHLKKRNNLSLGRGKVRAPEYDKKT